MLNLIKEQINLKAYVEAEKNLKWLSSRFFLYLPNARNQIRTYEVELAELKKQLDENIRQQEIQNKIERNLLLDLLHIQQQQSTKQAAELCRKFYALTGDTIWQDELQKLEQEEKK